MKILALLIAMLFPLHAAAIGEEFKLRISGMEYCDTMVNHRLTSRNTVPMWVLVVDENTLLVSTSADFLSNPVELYGFALATSKTTGAFVAHTDLDNGGFVSFDGTVTVDKYGTVKRMSGRFLQFNLFGDYCFSTGTASTAPK